MNKPFIHLRCLSSYSLSESTLKIPNLVSQAKNNNMPAIALTDNNNMFGVFEFSQECLKNNIQPIIGTSINYLPIANKKKISQITFLAKDEIGYRNLLHLSSLSHINNTTGVGVNLEDIETHSKGLFCYIGGEYNPLMILKTENRNNEFIDFIENFKKIFDDNFLFEILAFLVRAVGGGCFWGAEKLKENNRK